MSEPAEPKLLPDSTFAAAYRGQFIDLMANPTEFAYRLYDQALDRLKEAHYEFDAAANVNKLLQGLFYDERWKNKKVMARDVGYLRNQQGDRRIKRIGDLVTIRIRLLDSATKMMREALAIAEKAKESLQLAATVAEKARLTATEPTLDPEIQRMIDETAKRQRYLERKVKRTEEKCQAELGDARMQQEPTAVEATVTDTPAAKDESAAA